MTGPEHLAAAEDALTSAHRAAGVGAAQAAAGNMTKQDATATFELITSMCQLASAHAAVAQVLATVDAALGAPAVTMDRWER